jgi:hypothetical protein
MKFRLILYVCLGIAALCQFPAYATQRWTFKSVKNFGAVGDGTHDDTGAIQAAIAAGAAVYFPPGIYKYVGNLTLPTNKSYRIFGDGPGVSTILFSGPNAGVSVRHTASATLNVEGLTLMADATCPNCGTALSASFDQGLSKYHTATIHNVQIIGSARDGTTGGYWTNGIYLYQAANAVIDKVEVSGNKNVTQNGIQWDGDPNPTPSPPRHATTGVQLSNIEVKWCNTGLEASGHAEGLYMTGFEIVSCGRNGPAISLSGSTTGAGGVFQLANGLVDSVGGGISMSGFVYGKVANVSFRHNGSEIQSGTMLNITSVQPVQVSDCSFYGSGGTTPLENGIWLNSVTGAQISGNNFINLQATDGYPIVLFTGSSLARITDNLFTNVRARFYIDQSVTDTYYCGNDPTNTAAVLPRRRMKYWREL